MPLPDKILDEGLTWLPPKPSPRALKLPHRPGRADAFVGLRRAGKTWRMFQHMHELLAAGVDRERLLYINLEDERLARPEVADLTALLEAWQQRVPAVREEGGHLYLDEVQRVAGWERFVRRLLETTSIQVTVTGSSSQLLAGELATTLRGRCHRLEVLPFSFGEWLRRLGELPTAEGALSTAEGQKLADLFQRYLWEGGLPDLFAEQDEALRLAWLQDHAHVVVLRDVAERYRVANLTALWELARELLASTARKFSLNRFYNKLKSQGYRVSRDSLRAWYGHLQEAFLVSGIPVASRSTQVRRVNPEKVYVIDTGLALAHASLGAADTGHLLETAVYWQLRRRGHACTWVHTRSGREVDFLAVAPGGGRTLVQVCADFSAAKTQERELAGLFEALEELHVSEGLVVTFNHEEEFEVGQGRVKIVPAWKWFLLNPSNSDSRVLK